MMTAKPNQIKDERLFFSLFQKFEHVEGLDKMVVLLKNKNKDKVKNVSHSSEQPDIMDANRPMLFALLKGIIIAD